MEFLCSLWLLPECWERRWSLNRPKVAATAIETVRQNAARVTAKAEATVVHGMAKVVENAAPATVKIDPAMVKVAPVTGRLATVRDGQVTEVSAVAVSDLPRIRL